MEAASIPSLGQATLLYKVLKLELNLLPVLSTNEDSTQERLKTLNSNHNREQTSNNCSVKFVSHFSFRKIQHAL